MKLFQPVFNSINFKVNTFNFAAPAPSTPEKLNSFLFFYELALKYSTAHFSAVAQPSSCSGPN